MILIIFPVLITAFPFSLIVGYAGIQGTMFLEMILLSAIVFPLALLLGYAGAYRMDSISCEICNSYYHATIEKSLADIEKEEFFDNCCVQCRGYM